MPTATCPTCKHQQSLDTAQWTGIEYQAVCERCGAQLNGFLLPSGARSQSPSDVDEWPLEKHID
jgi:transcription elongation factor Elf1